MDTSLVRAFDVLVLGAGPAGCAAALQLVRHGCRVAIVECAAFPRHRPGETLTPGIETVLRLLGAEQAVLQGDPVRHPGVFVEWGRRRALIPFGADEKGPWCGFQVPREELDSRLLSIAEARGVFLITTRPRTALMRRGRVVGLSCDAGEVNAVWTIDATGRSRWLARQLGVNVRQRSIPLYARYGYASVDAEHPSLPHLHCDSAGWSWTAKVGPRRAHWLRMSVDGTMPRKTCFPLALQGKVETRTYGADVTWDAAAELTGPGWLLVGDAAGQLDPSSGHGVLRATMGGVMAAQAVVRGATGAYTDWSREWYERDAAQMAANYREAGLRVGRQ